jgi:hypothetical protein
MNKNKIWLLFAMIAIVGFMAVSCGDEDADIVVSISPSSNVGINTKLTVTHDGPSDATIQWQLNGTNVGTGESSYTPTAQGTCTVTVSGGKGYIDGTASVNVKGDSKYFGTWKSSDNDLVIISSNSLAYYYSADNLAYKMEGLTWTGNLTYNTGDFRTGYTIRGKITENNVDSDGDLFTPPNDNGDAMANKEEFANDYWYIKTDGSGVGGSISWGDWGQNSGHNPQTGGYIFVKQN